LLIAVRLARFLHPLMA